MKASYYTKYGEPEVLSIQEVPQPKPKDDEVLIKIHATTVNRTDCGFRKPEYFIVRLFSGLFKPNKHILGSEFSGEIETIGSQVKTFKKGDSVFGLSTYQFGTHAEYICIKEKGSITFKPENYSHQEAAAVCDGLMLAINYIRKIDFSKKPKILINGASGSIGSAALQLACYYGAENVTAVCNTKNIELIKSLGATKVYDYTCEDFTKSNEKYDVILDAVGKSSFFRCKPIMNKNAVYFSTELGYLSQNIFLALLTPLFSKKKVKFPIPNDNKDLIESFKKIIETGKYKAVIDRTYSLDQIVEATHYVESQQKTGNVLIQLVDTH